MNFIDIYNVFYNKLEMRYNIVEELIENTELRQALQVFFFILFFFNIL